MTDTPTLHADPAPPAASPLILTDTYVEVNGVNLRCLAGSIGVEPENKLVTVTSFCSEVDYPASTKWSFTAKFFQSFDAGATYQTLAAALAAYQAGGTKTPYKARAHSSRPASPTNPEFSGLMIPQPFPLLKGDAGTASEIDISWTCDGEPDVDFGGAVVATGATAGTPGIFTPLGATAPANLAAMSAIAATPPAAWTAGQYVVTADMLGCNWDGSAWVAGIA